MGVFYEVEPCRTVAKGNARGAQGNGRAPPRPGGQTFRRRFVTMKLHGSARQQSAGSYDI
jgi:hypothetical protein